MARSTSIVRTTLNWLGRHELGFLLAIAGVVAGLWCFAAIADEVMEGGTKEMDRRILLAMRNPSNLADPIGPPFIEEAARDVTALGGVTVLGFLTAVITGYLMLAGRTRMAGFLLGSIVTGLIASTVLKDIFHRPRPDLVPHAVFAMHSSFPSGHSMLSAITYLTLGALLARSEPRKRIKSYFMLIAVILTVAVGISRVYLGVHWPTDVVAGWTAGAVWALLSWLAARWLQRRRAIESVNESNEG